MEVILLSRVRNLGDLGDTVKVRAGYGRNYLIPKGIALPANKANVAEFEYFRYTDNERVATVERCESDAK